MAARASSLTTLVWGSVKAPVGLYLTTDDKSKAYKWDTAGPNGGVLRYEQRPQEVEPSETPPGDALGVETAPPEEWTKGVGEAMAAADPGADDRPDFEALASQAAPTSAPAEYVQKLVEEGSGEVVEPDALRRGIRRDDGTFVDLTDHLTKIDEETRLEEMRIVDFIDVGQVRRDRVKGSYYLGAAQPGAPKVLRLLYESMRATRRVAVVRFRKTKRQTLGIIVADGRRGVLEVLDYAWPASVRDVPGQARSIQAAEVTPQEVDVAASLIHAMADTHAALDEMVDDAVVAIEELRRKVAEGEDIGAVERKPTPAQEPSLMEALTASVEATRA